jgi:hypothetical protein
LFAPLRFKISLEQEPMMKRALALYLFLLAFANPARAEFFMVAQDAAAPSQPEPAQASRPALSLSHASEKHPKHRRHSSARVAAAKDSSEADAIATGFGAQVPLAFAIRQMAPDGYEIILEPPANPDSPVDWRGGKPWTQALAAAVQPLGLAVSVHDKSITISPAHAQ